MRVEEKPIIYVFDQLFCNFQIGLKIGGSVKAGRGILRALSDF